jgi:hypothetical protein
METLERFQQNQRVIEDFASRTLAAIPCEFGRLVHISTLRDLASGQYRHEGLAIIYSETAVHHALAYCHEQLFCRILEMPLERQEQDLARCLAGMEGPTNETAARWLELESYRLLIPLGISDYLRDLFCSNMRALLGLLAAQRVNPEPGA